MEWVSIQDPSAKSVKTKIQGQNEGASIFNGGEGIIFTNDKDSTSNIFFTCKRGGQAGLGQIWKYSPSKSKISLFYFYFSNTNNVKACDFIPSADSTLPLFLFGTVAKTNVCYVLKDSISWPFQIFTC